MENYLEINYEKNMSMLSQAISYCDEDLSHEDIIKELSSDNDLKKQLCLIELNKINSQKEADILVWNLTGKSGPIRETASFKILDLISRDEFRHFFQSKEILGIFIKGITDINPSVSRNIVEVIKYVDDSQLLYFEIIKELENTLSQMEDVKQNRSYVLNKKNFNLYWNIEALISISSRVISDEKLLEILKQTALSIDYTIREKTAKAAMEFSLTNSVFNEIIDILKADENVYVRKHLRAVR